MTDHEDIKDIQKCLKGFVPWKVFIWTVGIFTAIVGWVFYSTTIMNASIQTNSTEGFKIQAQLSQIQTDLQWIKQTLADHRLNE